MEAYYNPEDDYINLPKPKMFKDTTSRTATEGYYSTIFHELTHWTGAKHRLDRLSCETFVKEDYAFEELVAELGAAMICASTGVTPVPRLDHAHYIGSWLKALRNNKYFIFSAATKAQKAADYLFNLQQSEEA